MLTSTTTTSIGETAGHILIVDDDPGVCKAVSVLLVSEGHTVGTATGVAEGLAALTDKPYEVALVDLHMPGHSGLELLESIKSRGLPVVPILLTGTTDVATAVAAMKQGAFDYLPKPPTRDALGWAVRRALGVARARRRERALERVVSEWEATFDACPDQLLILDPAGTVLRANWEVSRRTGADRAELVGRVIEAVFPDGLGAAIRSQQRAPSETVSAGTAVYDTRLDGHFLLSVGAFPTVPGVDAAVVVIRDVSDLVRGEEERKRLLRQILTTQEDEQRKLARELHDGIGQTLASLSVGLDGLKETIGRFRQVAGEGQEEVRRLVRGLRPMLLDDLGLSAALSRLAEQITRLNRISVDFVESGESNVRLPPEIESTLYRIAQEALTNVVKYSRARSAEILLEVSAFQVRLSVTDNGVGFVSTERPTGFGLVGMRERAQLLRGTFTVESAAGRGTTVTAIVPLVSAHEPY